MLPRTPKSEENARRVVELADGSRSSPEIAALLGLNPRHVRKILLRLDLPRLRGGYLEGHRLVLEQHLGRYVLPLEVVDHIDGLTLHNDPTNLRLFANNAEHLKATLTGKVPQWSDDGFENMKLRHRRGVSLQLVDIYRQRKEAGALRLRQILLLALSLGIDSPHLLGTSHWTKKAGIDMSSRSTIEHALDDLCLQWGWPQTL